MGASILYPNHMKNRAPNLPAKSFKTIFSAWQLIFLTSESNFSCKILKFLLGIAPKALCSVPNKQNSPFYSILLFPEARVCFSLKQVLAIPYRKPIFTIPGYHPPL